MKNPSQKSISLAASLVLLAQVAGGFAASSASAADMLAGEVQETTQVEYGTGWYLRGEVSLTAHENLFSSESSTPIIGTPNQLVKTKETSNVFSAGVGVGFRFSNNFRADLGLASMGASDASETQTLTVLRAPCASGFQRVLLPDGQGGQIEAIQGGHAITNCTEESTTSYELQNVMGNIFYDFDSTFLGMRPFIGVAAGLVRNQFTSTVGSVTCTPSAEERCGPTDGGNAEFGETYQQQGTRNNGTAYHLATALTLGGSYSLGDNLFLDTSYTFMKTLEDPIWGGPSGIVDASVPTSFHSLKLGIRLEIW
ncbi:MAG: hypothetical protein V3V02_02040 [Rhizobiaceae bacterium]